MFCEQWARLAMGERAVKAHKQALHSTAGCRDAWAGRAGGDRRAGEGEHRRMMLDGSAAALAVVSETMGDDQAEILPSPECRAVQDSAVSTLCAREVE